MEDRDSLLAARCLLLGKIRGPLSGIRDPIFWTIAQMDSPAAQTIVTIGELANWRIGELVNW